MSILTQDIPPCEVCHIVHEDIVSLKNEATVLAVGQPYWLCVDTRACCERQWDAHLAARAQETAEPAGSVDDTCSEDPAVSGG